MLRPHRLTCLAPLLALSSLGACNNDTMLPPPGSTGGSALPGSGGAVGVGGGPGSGGFGATASGGSVGSGGAAPGTGGSIGSGGAPASGGSAGSGSATSSGGSGATGSGGDSGIIYEGEGTSEEDFYTAEVSRNGVPYLFITNGWGPNFGSATHSWLGTSFVVDQMQGSAGPDGEPASYPATFCGRYSVPEVPDCGLPAARSDMTALLTGWRWASNGNDAGQYNAAYDIWLGTETQFQMYFMVWLRDPTNFVPAGGPPQHTGVTVEGVPGTWDIVAGSVGNRPIVNYVVPPGTELTELEFDVLDFFADAENRGYDLPTHVRAVAAGFEIWEGPIAGLTSEDFWVDVQ